MKILCMFLIFHSAFWKIIMSAFNLYINRESKGLFCSSQLQEHNALKIREFQHYTGCNCVDLCHFNIRVIKYFNFLLKVNMIANLAETTNFRLQLQFSMELVLTSIGSIGFNLAINFILFFMNLTQVYEFYNTTNINNFTMQCIIFGGVIQE